MFSKIIDKSESLLFYSKYSWFYGEWNLEVISKSCRDYMLKIKRFMWPSYIYIQHSWILYTRTSYSVLDISIWTFFSTQEAAHLSPSRDRRYRTNIGYIWYTNWPIEKSWHKLYISAINHTISKHFAQIGPL